MRWDFLLHNGGSDVYKRQLFRRKQFQHKVTKEKFSPFSLDYTGFGKTVFLTYEEAEAALEGMKNG